MRLWTLRDRNRTLKRTEQAVQFLDVSVDGLNKQVMPIDDSRFGSVPRRGTTDTIVVFEQLQEINLAMPKRMYMAFVDLQKALDCVPQFFWWTLGKLNVDECIMR